MIDIKKLRENPEIYRQACQNKGSNANVDLLLEHDIRLRQIQRQLQEIATEKNQTGKSIAKMKDDTQRQTAINRMSELKNQEKQLNDESEQLRPQIEQIMLSLPMPAHPNAPIGPDESGNIEVKRWGDVREFDFEPKDHITLGKDLGGIDVERGVKLSGSRNYVLTGDCALLHQAVLRLAHDLMVAKGFIPLTVPVLTREATFMGTGWFPEGKSQVYEIPTDELFLVGTAEVPATSLHMDEILSIEDLPIRYVAQSLCFRREAGAAGKDTYGLYRIHQFEKVEQVIICPYDLDQAEKWHQHMIANAEKILQMLNLPYRVVEICTGDMGLGKYRMFDIETYMPSRNDYCETHSASNFLDFQARRLNLRYRDQKGKVRYCITMNNTVIASPRIIIPLLELNQTEIGDIMIPEALQKYMHGKKCLKKN